MKNRLAHLDMMRGMAALAVCAGHVRSSLLVESSQLRTHGWIVDGFYYLTGLGHQAVVVFFVLSGFFVGGGAVKAFSRNIWSWREYAIRRLSRLWIVLLPALFLTLAFDLASYHLAPSGLSLSTFLGNVFFLQTISVPVFGSNTPLWSLANEFWYYLLFPLFLGALKFPKWRWKIISLSLAVLLLIWLPQNILSLGLIWLFGVGVYLAGQNPWFKQNGGKPVWLVISGLIALVSLVFADPNPPLKSDYAVGIAFALFIATLSVHDSGSTAYARMATASGETSYTLYLSHYPFLVFIFFACLDGRRFQPDLERCFWYLGLLAVTLVYTTAVWWCFERNTDRIRKRLFNK